MEKTLKQQTLRIFFADNSVFLPIKFVMYPSTSQIINGRTGTGKTDYKVLRKMPEG
jgi:hypothetical protein